MNADEERLLRSAPKKLDMFLPGMPPQAGLKPCATPGSARSADLQVCLVRAAAIVSFFNQQPDAAPFEVGSIARNDMTREALARHCHRERSVAIRRSP